MDGPVCLIVNPHAGAGRALRLLPGVEAELRAQGFNAAGSRGGFGGGGAGGGASGRCCHAASRSSRLRASNRSPRPRTAAR